MTTTPQQYEALADALYERHGRPLEAEHWGRFVAIAESGGFVLGDSLIEIMEHATAVLGRGTFIFKVGEHVVGRWR
jgi:hypothetical protein